jgi:hypothetical protein
MTKVQIVLRADAAGEDLACDRFFRGEDHGLGPCTRASAARARGAARAASRISGRARRPSSKPVEAEGGPARELARRTDRHQTVEQPVAAAVGGARGGGRRRSRSVKSRSRGRRHAPAVLTRPLVVDDAPGELGIEVSGRGHRARIRERPACRPGTISLRSRPLPANRCAESGRRAAAARLAFEMVGEHGIRPPERERLGVRALLQADRRRRRDRTPLPCGQRLGGIADVLEGRIGRHLECVCEIHDPVLRTQPQANGQVQRVAFGEPRPSAQQAPCGPRDRRSAGEDSRRRAAPPRPRGARRSGRAPLASARRWRQSTPIG